MATFFLTFSGLARDLEEAWLACGVGGVFEEVEEVDEEAKLCC